MSASQGQVLTGVRPYAELYAHAGLVALDGHKMSKSRGNLVFVSRLLEQGVDPAAIRLAILVHHYRDEWEWTDEGLRLAQARLDRWREATDAAAGPAAIGVLDAVRERLADDLDAPGALAVVDAWVEEQLTDGGTEAGAPGLVVDVVDALLGVRLHD
jgi:L-cysteine:1D-myo-inositol 2-amino-2-deoxy-alpha-D-glucopyranoside ligase